MEQRPRPGPRVVVVADRSGDRLPPGTAAAVAEGWAARAPHAQVEAHESSDGGAGLAALVADRLGGSTQPVLVPSPSGGDVPAAITLARPGPEAGAGGEPEDGAGRTAYLDTAEVAGRHLVGAERLRDPEGLSSAGVGRMLRHARDLGARRIVVGVGPLACHDGGLGLLAELGAGDDLARLAEVRREWAGTRLVLATTTEASLLGFHGASAGLGELGVAPEVTQRLENSLGGLTDRVNAVLPPQQDLLTGLPRRPDRLLGAGAGGGVGYALHLLGARTDTGARLLLDELGIRHRLPGALLVLVTEAYDHQTVHAGVVADTARAALESGTPAIVLAREVAVGRRDGMSLGVSGSYPARAEEDLAALAGRVARTWTPPPAR